MLTIYYLNNSDIEKILYLLERKKASLPECFNKK